MISDGPSLKGSDKKSCLQRNQPLLSLCNKAEAIAEVDLLSKSYERVDGLSGGQRQQVAIARVLAQAPDLILADEPVSNLDPALTLEIIDLLTKACWRRTATLIMAVHQPDLAIAHLARIIAVKDGRIVFDGPPAALTEEVRSRIYDCASERRPA